MQNETRNVENRTSDEQQRIIQLEIACRDLNSVYEGACQFSED